MIKQARSEEGVKCGTKADATKKRRCWHPMEPWARARSPPPACGIGSAAHQQPNVAQWSSPKRTNKTHAE